MEIYILSYCHMNEGFIEFYLAWLINCKCLIISLVAWHSSLVNTLHLMVRFDTPSHSQFYSKKFYWLYPHDIFPLYIIK